MPAITASLFIDGQIAEECDATAAEGWPKAGYKIITKKLMNNMRMTRLHCLRLCLYSI